MKPQQEFFLAVTKPLEDLPTDEGTLQARTLSKDEKTGDATIILYHSPGSVWGGGKSITHTYFEECLLLKGRLFDVGLGTWFEAGSYCSRPPGMVHGPYKADPIEGCEEIAWIRYPSPSPSP